MPGHSYNMIVVIGPTATGKTRLGVSLARKLGGEIISADSRQVYRGLDIGTGKDLEEYGRGTHKVAVHLIDVVDPMEVYNLYMFQRQCSEVIRRLWAKNTLPVMVGGTGLYVESILLRYDLRDAPDDPELKKELDRLSMDELVSRLVRIKPKLHNTTDLVDREHLVRAIEIATHFPSQSPPDLPQVDALVLGTGFSREEVYSRIGVRLRQRLEQGLVEEVQGLVQHGVTWERLDDLGLEYRYVALYLRGEIKTLDDLHDKLWQAIRRFARRQMAWFRRMERRGVEIHWLAGADVDQALELIDGLGRFDIPVA